MTDGLYFGVIGRPGHGFFGKDLASRSHGAVLRLLGLDRFDGHFTPATGYTREEVEGASRLWHLVTPKLGVVTILAFHDRSGDHRPASNSAFVLIGQHEFDDAVAIARDLFPTLFERFTFELHEAPLPR